MTNQQQALFYAGLMLITLLTAQLLAILFLNDGTFIFTLDDPYIHLALAENLIQGHYGVNLNEFSAPSSSILWPLLIAPLTLLPASDVWVLLLNTLFALASLKVFSRVIQQIEQALMTELDRKTTLLLYGGFILAANLTGLVFTGMEHSLQVLLAMLVVCGLIEVSRGGSPSFSLWLAIVLSPLVRYEGLALSGAALFFLFVQRYYWQSVISGLLIAIFLGMFSWFLLSLGLSYLPDSVLTKSDLAASGIDKLLGNLQRNFIPNTVLKASAMVLMAFYLLLHAGKSIYPFVLRLLALLMTTAIVLHLFAGSIGWFFRYEIYIWISGLCMLLYLVIFKFHQSQKKSWVDKACLIILMLVGGLEHAIAAITTPIAANNIYGQQYQMHRFINDYYRKPIAVNDLGLTTYQNPQYVLDLYGLGSGEARKLRDLDNAQWMNDLVDKHEVNLIMIYDHRVWFPELPENWIKLGELRNRGIKLNVVLPLSFFTPCEACVKPLRKQLESFSTTLPGKVYFEFAEVEGNQTLPEDNR